MTASDCVLGVTNSLSGRRWLWRTGEERVAAGIAQKLDLPEIVSRLLSARGIGIEAAAALIGTDATITKRYLRALADAENVRRRAQKEVADAKAFGIAAFAKDILGVADNLGRALAALPAEERKAEGAVKTLIAGIELTDKDLLRILERHGIRKLVPLGEKFDPNFHEALFTVPDASVPPGTVSKVVEPGYAIGSRPLRPAKVGVAVAPA